MELVAVCVGGAVTVLSVATAARYIGRVRADLRLLRDAARTIGQPTYRPVQPRTKTPVARLAEAFDTAHLRTLDATVRQDEASRRHRTGIAHAAHDLRLPLESIRAAVTALTGGTDPASSPSSAYRRVAATAARLADLVDTLLKATCRTLYQPMASPYPNRAEVTGPAAPDHQPVLPTWRPW